MNEIKTVVFDYGGVISQPQDVKLFEKLRDILGDTTDTFDNVYREMRNDYDAGKISAGEYWQLIAEKLQSKKLSDAEIEELTALDVKSWAVINSGAIKLIDELKNKKIKLGILSNMTFDSLTPVMNSEWIKYFDVRVFSCEEKICKPDRRIYEILVERISEKPENILFIDDVEANIESAKKTGLNAILFTNLNKLAENLSTFFK